MIKKIKTIQADSFYNVDPTGFTPVSPLVKGRILLHKLRAQGPRKDVKTKEAPLQELPLFDKRRPVVYTDSTFYSYYIKLINLVKNLFVDNFY